MKHPLTLVSNGLSPRTPVDLSEVARHAETSDEAGIAGFEAHPLDGYLALAITAIEADLVPAGREKAFGMLRFAIRMLGAKAMPNDILSGYAAILGELPLDLLAKAMRDGLSTATWHKLPPPGIFMNAVRPDLERRQALLSSLQRRRDRVQLVSRTRRPTATPQLEATTFRPPPLRLRRIDGE